MSQKVCLKSGDGMYGRRDILCPSRPQAKEINSVVLAPRPSRNYHGCAGEEIEEEKQDLLSLLALPETRAISEGQGGV